MIQTARHKQQRVVPRSPSLVGNKLPMPHRFHLADGRVFEGDMHRSPNSRLGDHVSMLKGFASVTNATFEDTGATIPYLLLNLDHVLFIEEMGDPAGSGGDAEVADWNRISDAMNALG